MVGFVFLVYIVEYIDLYIKFMNNIFIRYCLIFKKKNYVSRNIIYFIYVDNFCIYYNVFLCVIVSDILKIIIWNYNIGICIKLVFNFD